MGKASQRMREAAAGGRGESPPGGSIAAESAREHGASIRGQPGRSVVAELAERVRRLRQLRRGARCGGARGAVPFAGAVLPFREVVVGWMLCGMLAAAAWDGNRLSVIRGWAGGLGMVGEDGRCSPLDSDRGHRRSREPFGLCSPVRLHREFHRTTAVRTISSIASPPVCRERAEPLRITEIDKACRSRRVPS